jgi:hypothetical protein
MPSRYLTLAVLLAVLALAGCGEPAGELAMTEVTDAELADRASIDTASLSDDPRALVGETVENGSTTRTGSNPPFDPSLSIAYEGRYYNVSYTVAEEVEATRYSIELTRVDGDVGGGVALADLPQVDREALDGLLAGPLRNTESESAGIAAVYTDAEAADSRLVPEPDVEFVVHEGTRYRVEVTGSRAATVTTYRYEATELAAADAAFADYLRERYLFTLGDLSDAEREIVEQAAGSEYQESDESSEAFRSLARRLQSHRGITEDQFSDGEYYGGRYLVEYDGTVYWTTVRLRDPLTTTP